MALLSWTGNTLPFPDCRVCNQLRFKLSFCFFLFPEDAGEGGAVQAAVRGDGGGVPAEGAGGVGGSQEGAEGVRVLARHLEDQALLLRLLSGELAHGYWPKAGDYKPTLCFCFIILHHCLFH